MEKVCYSIGEVAELLGENTSLVRFWTDSFPRYVKPRRNPKGNRIYSKEDIAMLKQIHYLLKVEGYTLEGAERKLKGETRGLKDQAKALETLRKIRQQLVEIRKTL